MIEKPVWQATFSVLCGGLLLIGCTEPPTEREIARVRAPDQRIDAVATILGGGGATVGDIVWIYLVPAGSPIQRDDEPAARASHVSPQLELSWTGNRTLQISYHKAHFLQFTNGWYDKRLATPASPYIELRLRPMSSNSL